jgi:hypothetical protein
VPLFHELEALLHQCLQCRLVSRPALFLLRREPQTLLERGEAGGEPRIDRRGAVRLRETWALLALSLPISLLSINNRRASDRDGGRSDQHCFPHDCLRCAHSQHLIAVPQHGATQRCAIQSPALTAGHALQAAMPRSDRQRPPASTTDRILPEIGYPGQGPAAHFAVRREALALSRYPGAVQGNSRTRWNFFLLRPVTHTANVECPDSDVCMPLQHALVQRRNQRDIGDYML